MPVKRIINIGSEGQVWNEPLTDILKGASSYMKINMLTASLLYLELSIEYLRTFLEILTFTWKMDYVTWIFDAILEIGDSLGIDEIANPNSK